MFDGIVSFFGHFQEKDWITFAASIAALAVSSWTWWRNHRLGHLKLLEHQADFSAKWRIDTSQQYVFLEISNIGTGRAYKVRAHLPSDPQHLLGLEETAQGPLIEGQHMAFGSRISAQQLEFGAEAGTDKLGYGAVIDWVDDYGIPRRKMFTHGGIPRESSEGAWQASVQREGGYSGGSIGTTAYYDPRMTPAFRFRPWRRFWVERH